MDTSASMYAHNNIIFSSVIVCGGVCGSTESELGKKRNVQTGEYFANMIGKVRLEAFVAWCKFAVECLRKLQDGFEGSDLNDAGVVEDKVRVNNTVVDNEL